MATIKDNLEEIKERVKGLGDEARIAAEECKKASAAYDELCNKGAGKFLTEEQVKELHNKAFLLGKVTSDIESYANNVKVKISLTELCRVLIKEISEFME